MFIILLKIIANKQKLNITLAKLKQIDRIAPNKVKKIFKYLNKNTTFA